MKTKTLMTLKDVRLHRGYSLQKLADMCEISKSLASKIENGNRNFTVDNLLKYSKILELELPELIRAFDGRLSKEVYVKE